MKPIYKSIVAAFLVSASMVTFAQTVPEVFNLYKSEVVTAPQSEEENQIILKQVQSVFNESTPLVQSQYFVLADRNPKKQNLYIAYYDADTKAISLSEAAKISTGSLRKLHFITPLGWFENLPEFGSHRAMGTKNENGIRGLGKKGMRVWDFGWHKAQAGWKKEEYLIDIRLQMHATDPDILESRLGRPDSQGCVRLQSKMNQFLDKYGIIDKKYEEVDPKAWVLRSDRTPVPNAGSYLLVVETPDKAN